MIPSPPPLSYHVLVNFTTFVLICIATLLLCASSYQPKHVPLCYVMSLLLKPSTPETASVERLFLHRKIFSRSLHGSKRQFEAALALSLPGLINKVILAVLSNGPWHWWLRWTPFPRIDPFLFLFLIPADDSPWLARNDPTNKHRASFSR